MATLPSLEDAERAILNVFAEKGTRPGESIKSLLLTELLVGNPAPFRASDINAAIQSMKVKCLIEEKLGGFYTLLKNGFEQV